MYIGLYHGRPVKNFNYYFPYNENDYAMYEGILYKSLQNYNSRHFPDELFPYWEKIASIDEDTTEKENNISGNHIGNISGDNVVVYGNNTGDISANGNKSVVVVFGNVIGNITAEQVVRFDNLYKEAIKEIALKTQGKNND